MYPEITTNEMRDVAFQVLLETEEDDEFYALFETIAAYDYK